MAVERLEVMATFSVGMGAGVGMGVDMGAYGRSRNFREFFLVHKPSI